MDEGEWLAICGPNGAGKSTLLRLLATLQRPSSGQLRIAGWSVSAAGPAVRRLIGYVGHQTYLYDGLSALENLRFYGRMYRLSDVDQRATRLLDQLGLAQRQHSAVRTLSRGTQQRVTLARALLHNPPLLLLDEPETGLDQASWQALVGLIQGDTATRRTVVLATHAPDRWQAWLTRRLLLERGRLVADEALAPTTPVSEMVRP